MKVKRWLPALVIALAAVFVGSLWMITADAQQTGQERMQEWNNAIAVPLVGDRQASGGELDGTGIAVFWPNDDMSSMCYIVHVDDLDGDVTQISINRAQQAGGTTGEIVLVAPGDQIIRDDDGIVAMGNLSSDDLTGAMAGGSMSQLFDDMDAGALYVNVITDKHPDGEISGSIDVHMTCTDVLDRGIEMMDEGDGSGWTRDGASRTGPSERPGSSFHHGERPHR